MCPRLAGTCQQLAVICPQVGEFSADLPTSANMCRQVPTTLLMRADESPFEKSPGSKLPRGRSPVSEPGILSPGSGRGHNLAQEL